MAQPPLSRPLSPIHRDTVRKLQESIKRAATHFTPSGCVPIPFLTILKGFSHADNSRCHIQSLSDDSPRVFVCPASRCYPLSSKTNATRFLHRVAYSRRRGAVHPGSLFPMSHLATLSPNHRSAEASSYSRPFVGFNRAILRRQESEIIMLSFEDTIGTHSEVSLNYFDGSGERDSNKRKQETKIKGK